MPSGVYKRSDLCKFGHSLVGAYVHEGKRHCRVCAVDCQVARINRMRTDDPDRLKAKKRASYIRNADTYKARAKARSKTPKARAERIAWRTANHDRYYAAVKQGSNRRRARIAGCRINDFTASQWNLLLRVFNNHCAYCWAVSDNLHQDHIIPISKGGDHTLTNIVPACEGCNLSKGANEWAPVLRFGTYA